MPIGEVHGAQCACRLPSGPRSSLRREDGHGDGPRGTTLDVAHGAEQSRRVTLVGMSQASAHPTPEPEDANDSIPGVVALSGTAILAGILIVAASLVTLGFAAAAVAAELRRRREEVTFPCPKCDFPVHPGHSPCPNCHSELAWP